MDGLQEKDVVDYWEWADIGCPRTDGALELWQCVAIVRMYLHLYVWMDQLWQFFLSPLVAM